jgi:Co/Zn/Cd efflux system component
MSNCGCEVTLKNNEQKHVLYWLLSINAVLFVAEFGIGWFAQSTALIADSLDMLADAVVYAIGLYAVGRAAHHKARAAMLSGYFQMALGLLITADIVRRAYVGSEPASGLMMVMGSVALVGNVICLVLIQKHRHGDVNMRASWIFSSNDVIANAGVIASGALVGWLNARWPDMVIGCIIVVIVLRGAQMILKDARKELAQPDVKKTTCGTGQ